MIHCMYCRQSAAWIQWRKDKGWFWPLCLDHNAAFHCDPVDTGMWVSLMTTVDASGESGT